MKHTRRQFLKLSAMAVAGAMLAACNPPTAPGTAVPNATTAPNATKAPDATAVPTSKYKESPETAELVKAGTLPSVDKRLPVDPCVGILDGFAQEAGIYGGTLAMASSTTQCLRQALLTLTQDATKLFPELAKSWKYSDDGKILSVTLREGIKWSDGKPFTTEDVMYWYNSYLLNDVLVPVKPSSWKVNGKLMEVVKVDDFTFEARFDGPFYAAHYGMSCVAQRGHQAAGSNAWHLPKHYMEQFHIDTNPDAEKLAKDNGYETWNAQFAYWATTEPIVVGMPTLQAWTMTEKTVTGSTFKRNPYYHKVDPQGNQLPYINGVVYTPAADTKAHTMQMVSGQIDFEAWGIGLPDFPVLKQEGVKGGFEVWLGGDTWNAWSAYWLNENFKGNPEIAKIFQDKRVRQALSVAINRQEINDKVLLGAGIPTQVTVWNKASYFVQAYADAYAQYDPAMANKLLDEAGLTKRDAEGFRLFLNGDPMTIIIDLISDMPHWLPTGELVKSYWDAVGVRTVVNNGDRNLIWSRLSGGELQIFTWVMDGNHPFVLESSKWVNHRISWWAPEWASWIDTQGKSGLEPPQDVKDLYAMCETIPGTPPDKMGDLMKAIWKDEAENVRSIGTVGYAGKPVFAKVKLGNVNKAAFADNHDTGGTRGYWAELFYWKA